MDSVLFWNEVALQAVANDHSGSPPPGQQGGPGFTSRALAIVYAAIYDTSNSFVRTHKPYLTLEDTTHLHSVESAIGGAAVTTLRALYDKQSMFLDKALADFGVQIGGIDHPSFDLGRRIGTTILEARRHDGSDENRAPTHPDHVLPHSKHFTAPAGRHGTPSGKHKPDPLNPNQGLYAPTWGKVTPFVIKDIKALRSRKPPALDSDEYRSAFEEVKSKGTLESATRTEEETHIGLFWAYDGANLIGTPPRLFNQIARAISENQGFSQEENARFFALINLAMADAGIQCWDTKYHYNLWRPIVGIREDPGGSQDPHWQPLGSPRSNTNVGLDFTPPFPAYTSGHATFGAASMIVMKLFLEQGFDPNLEIKGFVSDELNGQTTDSKGVTRPKVPMDFTLDKAIQDNLESRVFLGVHWRFDGTEGRVAGEKIAHEVFSTVATPA